MVIKMQFDGWSCTLEESLPKIDCSKQLATLLVKLNTRNFYPHQTHFLHAVLKAANDPRSDCTHKFSLIGVHGSGKSYCVAIALALIMLNAGLKNEPLSGTVIAITEKQAESAFWKKLKYIQEKNPQLFEISNNTFWLKGNQFVCVNKRAFAKQNTHSLAGEHALNMVNIVDEASGAEPEAIDILKSHFTSEFGRLKGLFFLLGNPPKAPNNSEFYRVHKGEITGYNTYTITRKAVVENLEGDSYTNNVIREVQDVYGKDYDYKNHDLYKRLILGELPDEGGGQVFPEYVLSRARVREGWLTPPYYIAVDFAGADDPRDNKNWEKNDDSAILVFTPTAFVEGLTIKMKLPEFEQLIIKYIHQYKPNAVFCDGIGIGMGTTQRLQAQQFIGFKTEIHSIKGSEKAFNFHRFTNRRTENYWLLREWMEGKYDQSGVNSGGGVARLGIDRVNHLFNELRQIKFTVRRGLIALEPKSSLADSPDFADACAMAMTYQFMSAPVEQPQLQNYRHHSNIF